MLKGLTERAVSRMIDFALAPLKRKVRTMVMRAVVELVGDGDMMQTVQVSRAEDLLDDEIERFQQYGFSSVPYKDAEAIVLLLGGSADVPVAISVDDRRYRPTGKAEGEVMLYTKDHGVRLILKANGQVHLGTDPTNFVALANLVDARLSSIQSAFDMHMHPTGMGPSGPPTSLIVSLESVAATEVKAK